MRLVKYLAHSGVASRRRAENLIAAGRVRVAGETVNDPARDVDESSGVEVDGVPVAPEPRETWLVNKPVGVVSTAREPGPRRAVVELAESSRRLYPVGRLDADSSGLILLTNDGELADRLTHPRYAVPRTYRARLRRTPREAALRRLRTGVGLEDGPTAPAGVRRISPRVLEITIREGRNRQVRRMVEAVGGEVLELKRTRVGSLHLGRLPEGSARRLTSAEVETLRRESSAAASPPDQREAGSRSARA